MNPFDVKLSTCGIHELKATALDTIQVNVGLRCNLACAHCHLEAGSDRRETMSWETMALLLEKTASLEKAAFDITGGSPELNPNLSRFLTSLSKRGNQIKLRTNLVALSEPECDGLIELFARQSIALTASLPCYLEENVVAQRGLGVYEKSIAAMKKLNRLGYGAPGGLKLELVYNPGGPFLPPPQEMLEGEYRKELLDRHGVTFTNLIAMANMPLGRFGDTIGGGEALKEYGRLILSAFNPETIPGLMCRNLVNVAWDGSLHDCDFNAALKLPLSPPAPAHIRDFDPAALRRRRIVTGEHCLVCAAGQGSSCSGSLAA